MAMRNRLAGEIKHDVGNVWEPKGLGHQVYGGRLLRMFVLQIRQTTV